MKGEGALIRKIVREGSAIYLVNWKNGLPSLDITFRKHKIIGVVIKRIIDE